MSPKERASELSYQLAQFWGRRGQGKALKLSAIKCKKWILRLCIIRGWGKKLHVFFCGAYFGVWGMSVIENVGRLIFM